MGSLISPGIGLIFWTAVIFIIFAYLLTKFAWKPILKALKEREDTIENALLSAEQARKEMAELKAENEKILDEAKEERAKIISEAKVTKDKIVNEAKEKAKEEAEKMITMAKTEIDNQKKAAIAEVKNQVATLSIGIAEKILKEKLDSQPKQEGYIKDLVKDIKLN